MASPPRRTRAPARSPAAWGLLALLLAAPLGALAQGPVSTVEPVLLEYVVKVTPALAAEGTIEVTWKAAQFKDRISAFCLLLGRHEYKLAPGSFGPVPPWEFSPQDVNPSQGKPACDQGYRVLTKGLDQVEGRFALDVRRPAFSACGCEFNSYLGPQWGVVKAEALAIPFSYSYFEPQPTFRAKVAFELPQGWSVEAPWPRAASQAFTLPGFWDGAPLPRGFIAMGTFQPEPRQADGREFVYVRLAQELRDKAVLFDYLAKATPYYQGVYGNVTGSRVLVVSAGPPMFTGGLGSSDSLFVHQNSSRETIAHEYAHVWQRFQTIDHAGAAGGSSIWVNEGDADHHGALSRFVTETQPGFTLAKLNQEFRDDYDAHSSDPKFRQPLSVAEYGGEFEQVAYKKGLATLVFLDQQVRNLTGGSAGINDVLRELNVEYEKVVSQRSGERRMTNDDILRVVNRVVQRHANVDMRNFFDAYVWGAQWPPFVEVQAEVPIVFDRLELGPAGPVPGEPITARVLATNVRDAPEARSVQLLIDEVAVASVNISLGPRASQTITLQAPAPAPGEHTARVAYLRQSFQVLTPAQLSVDQVQPLGPAQAGVPFDLAVDLRNAGQQPAKARVEATLGGQSRAVEVQVPGSGTARATLNFVLPEEAVLEAQVRVAWGNQSLERGGVLTIGPRDRDNDGVPDAQDAYPDNPALSQANPVNDVRNKVPAPAAPLAAAVAAGLALALARRRA